jgi:hypothetical protein
MMDCKRQARDLCEVLGLPFEDAGTLAEQWIRQFAANVLREERRYYKQVNPFAEDLVDQLERRAKEIEGGE